MSEKITIEDVEGAIAREYFFSAADGVDGAGISKLRYEHPKEMLQIAPAEDDPDICATGIFPLVRVTYCVLVLRNGFTVTGESICARPEDYNTALGQKYARDAAIEKVFPLLIYANK